MERLNNPPSQTLVHVSRGALGSSWTWSPESEISTKCGAEPGGHAASGPPDWCTVAALGAARGVGQDAKYIQNAPKTRVDFSG